MVTVRIPRVSLRFPTLLDRYIVRRYLGFLALIMAGFVSIFVLAEFMDLFDDIQHNNVKGKVVLHYYAFHIFQVLFTVSPVAVLVTVLVTLGVLSRRNEITAMKAGGISVYRAAGPVLGLGLLIERDAPRPCRSCILPVTNRIAESDFNVIKGRPPQSSGQLDRRWILASDGRFYNYDFLVEAGAGTSTSVRPRPDPPRVLALRALRLRRRPARAGSSASGRSSRRRRSTAPPGPTTWSGAGGGASLPRAPSGSSTRSACARSARAGGELEPPSYFRREDRPSDTLGFAELRRQIEGLRARGFDVSQLSVELHRKLAFPMVGLVMTLIGIPFSFVVARRGALYGIGVSIVIGIVYWATMGIFKALGENGLLRPHPRRLGPEPSLRRRRPLPDVHARDLRPRRPHL